VATIQKIAWEHRRRLSGAGQTPWNLMQFCAFIQMPRYFFHVHHDRYVEDYEGEELPDKHAAWKEATVTAGQILQGLDGSLTPAREWRMEVTDEFQNPLFVLHISAERPR
jgi:hypothetical protein